MRTTSSWLATGFPAAVRQPLRFQPGSQVVTAFMAYCESMRISSGTPGSAAGLVGFLSRVPFLTRVPHEELEPLAQSSLIRRYGTLPIILAGTGLTVIAVFVALHGITVGHFVAALALVGIGWNFMYTGGTTLLTETYAPNEKARTQGLNDLIVFTTMGVSSFASGALVTATGWETMNRAALPVLAIIAFAAAWLMWMRHRVPAAA